MASPDPARPTTLAHVTLQEASLRQLQLDDIARMTGDVTFPRGSTWARNPLPRIWDSKLGLHDPKACPGPSTRAAGSPPGCMSFPAPCPWDTYNKSGLLPCTKPTKGGSHCQYVVHTFSPAIHARALLYAWARPRRFWEM